MRLLLLSVLAVAFTLTAAEKKRALPIYCPACNETLSLVPMRTVTNGAPVISEGNTIIKTTITVKCPVTGKKFTSGHDIYVGMVHASPPPQIAARQSPPPLPPLPPSRPKP